MAVVVFDPGHGGRKRGVKHMETVAYGHEAGYVFDVCVMARQMVEDMRWPVTVVLTRWDDFTSVPLSLRADKAREYNANLVIPVHYNSHEDTRVHGPMAFRGYGTKYSYEVAEEIIRSIGRSGEYVDNDTVKPMAAQIHLTSAEPDHWRNRAWQVLVHYGSMPAVLVELECVTHTESRQWLLSDVGRLTCATALANGVEKFLQLHGDFEGLLQV